MTPANIAGPRSQFTRSLRGVQALIQAMTGASEERLRRREYMARETERELARGERREQFEWQKTRAAKAFEAAEKERGLSAEERRQRMALVAAKYYEETGEMLPGVPGAPAAPGVVSGVAPARRAMSKPEMVKQLLRNARVRLEATGASRTEIEKAMIELGDRLAEMKTGALRRRMEMTEEPVPVAARELTEAELAEAKQIAPRTLPAMGRYGAGIGAGIAEALAGVVGYTPGERRALRGRMVTPFEQPVGSEALARLLFGYEQEERPGAGPGLRPAEQAARAEARAGTARALAAFRRQADEEPGVLRRARREMPGGQLVESWVEDIMREAPEARRPLYEELLRGPQAAPTRAQEAFQEPGAPSPAAGELIPSKKAEYLGRLRAQLGAEGFEPTTIDRMVRTASAEYEQGG